MSLVFLVVLVPLSYAAFTIYIHLSPSYLRGTQPGLNCFEADVFLFGYSRELAASALPPCVLLPWLPYPLPAGELNRVSKFVLLEEVPILVHLDS